ncbi:MAG: TIR domain-containing protein, partial [Saprospiraceae bacterium]|nr:TIR domain-containing protein [Saprospiraceae bacterium]
SISFNEIKLILIGNTKAGKSNLADFLVQGRTYSFSEEHKSSHGIHVWCWDITTADRLHYCIEPLDRLTVNIWDFGGQDFYHGTHELFFRHGAVYVLVWVADKSKEAEQPGFSILLPEDYWLDDIRHCAPDSPLFVVQNKTERDGSKSLPGEWEEQFEIDRDKQFWLSIREAVLNKQSKYSDRWDVFTTELLRELCTIPLREEVRINKDWLRLRDFIRELQTGQALSRENPFSIISSDKPYIDRSTFERFCHQVAPDFSQFSEAFLKLFDRRGALIYFAGHPRLGNWVFLHPQWVTNKMYDLLDMDLVNKQKDAGIFDRQYAKDKLGEDTDILLDLMLEFNVIYPDTKRNNTFVAVQYLPLLNPEDDLDDAYTAHQKEPSLELSLPLFHQQRLLRGMIARLGADPSLEKRLLRRNCILLKTSNNTFLRVQGREEDGRGYLSFYTDKPQKMTWVLQLWLEGLMWYFSQFKAHNLRPKIQKGEMIQDSHIRYLDRIKDVFSNKEKVVEFYRNVFEQKPPYEMEDVYWSPARWPKEIYVATIWGLMFEENDAHFTRVASEANLNRAESELRLYHHYCAQLHLRTNNASWVRFSALLDYAKRQESAYLPTVDGVGTTEAHPFYPFLESLGYIMKDQSKRIFISYSHKDEDPYKNELVNWFDSISGWGKTNFEYWDDRQIDAGANWKSEILETLNTSDIIVCLVSADFLASKFIRTEEIPLALKRREEEGAVVIPVVIRPCFWLDTPLGQLQAANLDAKPLEEYPSSDKFWMEVVDRIKKHLEK